MTVAEDREAYATSLDRELSRDSVVVLVIRDMRFTNPNAILDDFVELVTQNREKCERRLAASSEKCAFVLLSRTELAIPQISSPVVLPDWFPMSGGTVLSMRIEDLTWTADASLNAPEAKINELCEGLFDLEGALLGRIEQVRATDHRKMTRFLELIRREDGEKLIDIIAGAAEHLAAVTTPGAFRPSLRDARSLIARIWAVVQHRHPEQMRPPSIALAEALDLPDMIRLDWRESISSVLRRPSGGEADTRLRFARNIFDDSRHRLSTRNCSGASDEYEHYPVALLRSVSFDLRRSLADAEAVIRTLTP